MKVVHINISDSSGGASIAAYRHCEAMRKAGIDAFMLVLEKNKKSQCYIHGIISSRKFAFLLSRLRGYLMAFLLKPFRPWGVFSFPFWGVNVSRNLLLKEADIIYIHWVAGSMLSTGEIERILKLGKPVRWYMHDMNPITGGCHYAMDCVKYKSTCRQCPLLKSHPLGIDLARMQFKKRMKCWHKYTNLEAYTPSSWLANCVESSPIWKGHKIIVFPNVFDLKKFHQSDKKIARDLLGIDTHRKLVLFGAANINSVYKGWTYMRSALNLLDPQQYTAMILGEEDIQVKKDLNISCLFTGYLHDEYSLILAYNAADVFVSASLADNYPNVIMEAMACGLPCVGFNIGGITEQIHHKVNGYLAEAKDANSLAEGIRYVCEVSRESYLAMQKAARDFVEKKASYDVYKDTSICY